MMVLFNSYVCGVSSPFFFSPEQIVFIAQFYAQRAIINQMVGCIFRLRIPHPIDDVTVKQRAR